jgi:hypothetical protein
VRIEISGQISRGFSFKFISILAAVFLLAGQAMSVAVSS